MTFSSRSRFVTGWLPVGQHHARGRASLHRLFPTHTFYSLFSLPVVRLPVRCCCAIRAAAVVTVNLILATDGLLRRNSGTPPRAVLPLPNSSRLRRLHIPITVHPGHSYYRTLPLWRRHLHRSPCASSSRSTLMPHRVSHAFLHL